jgi:hypothetical protein
MATRITLAEYIRRNLPLIPAEDLCRNVGIDTINNQHISDEVTVVELDDDGKVAEVYKPKLVSTVPPEPEPPAPAPTQEDEPTTIDIAADRIFPDDEDDDSDVLDDEEETEEVDG